MCSGPSVPRKTGGDYMGVPANAKVKDGIGPNGYVPPPAVANLMQLVNRQEQAGGTTLRGLALPDVKPTGPADLKNLFSYLLPPRTR